MIETTKESSETMVVTITIDKGKTTREIARDKVHALETRDREANVHDRVHQGQSHDNMMVHLAQTTQGIEGDETTKSRVRSHSNQHLETLTDPAQELISAIEKLT